MSALENETTGDPSTFEHFGQTWKIPTRKNLSHIKYLRDQMQTGYGTIDLLIAEAFLSPAVSPANQQDPDQFAALMEIDPDESELDEFTTALSKAMGLGSSGNSKPSSAS